MDLKSLGRRDIFGILLPGVIVVSVSVYVLSGLLGKLPWPDDASTGLDLLLSVFLFVASYLAGSLLRLRSIIDVDEKAGNYLGKKWREECRKAGLTNSIIDDLKREFQAIKAELVQGGKVEASDVPPRLGSVWGKAKAMYRGQDGIEFGDWLLKKFDEWIWGTDEFPYPAWLNRLWQSGDFCTISDFFSNNPKTSIWLGKSDGSDVWRRKDFFNYCKMAVIRHGGQMADEVRAYEGLVRFFAGTVVALQLAAWLLCFSGFIVALICELKVVLCCAWKLGITSFSPSLSTFQFQFLHLIFTLIFICIVMGIRFQIVKHFRRIRNKEVNTVYHAFHLYSL